MIGRLPILGMFVLIVGTGCCSTPISTTIDTPPRPVLIPLTQELWDQIPLEAQDTIAHNDLALKQYAKRLEARIEAHNGAERD